MDQELVASRGWQGELLRAYAVFGVDPLNHIDEFGFGFPRLSVSFLREKAERQLRDALGRWREMRGVLDDGGGGVSLERASLVPGPRVMGRVEDLWGDRAALGEAFEVASRSVPVDGVHAESVFYKPVDSDEENMRQYINRMNYEKILYMKNLMDAGVLPEDPFEAIDPQYLDSYWLSSALSYENGMYADVPTMGAPLLAGSPEERLAMIPEFKEFLKQMEDFQRNKMVKDMHDRRNFGVPESVHIALTSSGHNDRPTVLSHSDFNYYSGYEIPGFEEGYIGNVAGLSFDNGTVLFRGKAGSGISSMDAMAAMQYAPPDDHYVGIGVYGNGLYFGDRETAYHYAFEQNDDWEDEPLIDHEKKAHFSDLMTDHGSVIAAKIKNDAVVMFKNKVQEMKDQYYRTIMESSLSEDMKTTLLDARGISIWGELKEPELFAAQTGIDVVVNEVGPEKFQNIVVFNRGALVMPDYGLTYTPRGKSWYPGVAPEPLRPAGVRLRRE